MILTRTVGLVESGIFTIAYANANLFLNIGKYGMRNYQVSDVRKEFSFSEYLTSRYLTTLCMFLVSVIYIFFTGIANDYSPEKSQIILWMCIFKLPDAFEDVFYGDYQKKGRLDVAAKCMAIRMILTILFFGIMIIFTRNLLISLIASTILTFALMFLLIGITYPIFKEEKKASNHVTGLLKTCFPVFLSSFLSFYIGNAPKYAIDAQLSDELQACYGFIAMPVFVIGLLNGFIFTPMILQLSCLWNDGKIKDFLRKVLRQICIVGLITFFCLIAAHFLGIPVLSLLYNTDLSQYKTELLILLLGGGFLGLSGVFCTVITIIRYQNALLIGYGIVALLALLLSNLVVRQFQIMGAALLYLALMILLCLCFIVILFIGIKRKKM